MTFIPMSTIRVKPLDERLRQLGGSVKLVRLFLTPDFRPGHLTPDPDT
jgi:hypothetical protein